MKKWLKRGVMALLVLLVIAAGLAFWKRDMITRLLAVNSLFTEENIVHNFSHMDDLFFSTPLPLPEHMVTAFEKAPVELTGLDNWIDDQRLTALVVLKDGALVHEAYFQSTSAEDRRISWSVAKSFLSALFGILLDEGVIESIDDPVTKYAPLLKDTAYDGVSIRNVLNMASGVTFDEDYLDFNSDINKMGRVLALGGSMDEFTAGLNARDHEPGTDWQYVSIDTHVIGMVIRGATGRGIPELLIEKVLAPLGLEADPYYLTDGYGVAFVLGGLNLRTRDYARFGQMFAQMGQWQGQQIVPADWVAQSTISSAPGIEPGEIGYGFQWWAPRDATEGEYFARGIYGQFVYINTPENVVIAVNSTDQKFSQEGILDLNIAMFRTIVEQLR